MNWQFVSSIGNSTTPIPRWAFLSFLSILLLVVHFPTLMNISPSTTLIRWLVMILLKRMPACVVELLKVAFYPQKWQSKTVSDVELQNLSLSKRLAILCFVIESWIGKELNLFKYCVWWHIWILNLRKCVVAERKTFFLVYVGKQKADINPQVLILFCWQIPVKIKNNSTDLCFYKKEGSVPVPGLFENFSA